MSEEVQADAGSDGSAEQPDVGFSADTGQPDNDADNILLSPFDGQPLDVPVDSEAVEAADEQPDDNADPDKDEPLDPKLQAALTKARQKDRAELDELKKTIEKLSAEKDKPGKYDMLAAEIVSNVMKNPASLQGYMKEYNLSAQESEQDLPEFTDEKQFARYVLDEAKKAAKAEATSASTLTKAELESQRRVSSAWNELISQDQRLATDKAYQQKVSVYANGLMSKYNGSNEAELLKEAYEAVKTPPVEPQPADQALKKKTPPPTEPPSRGVSKTVPKREGDNSDAAIFNRAMRRFAELDKKYQAQK